MPQVTNSNMYEYYTARSDVSSSSEFHRFTIQQPRTFARSTDLQKRN